MAPLISEYDRHMDQMTEQMEKYEVSEMLKSNFIKFDKLKSKKIRHLTGESTGIFWPRPAVVEEEYYFSSVRFRI